MTALGDALAQLEGRVSLHKAMLALDGVAWRPEQAQAALANWITSHWFCRRAGVPPKAGRASGDSGWVAHLNSLTRGASGWEPGYTLVSQGESDGLTGRRGAWAFVSDGRLSLFLDEPGQYTHPNAQVGDKVSVRVPRARENLVPHRFTLLGNHGPAPAGEAVAKLFVAVTLEGAALLVTTLSARGADGLRFSLYVANDPRDFDRADAVVLDVAGRDETAATRLLNDFFRQQPTRVRECVPPLQTEGVFPGLARADAYDREDVADGFVRRRAEHLTATVLGALHEGEDTAAQWLARLQPESS